MRKRNRLTDRHDVAVPGRGERDRRVVDSVERRQRAGLSAIGVAVALQVDNERGDEQSAHGNTEAQHDVGHWAEAIARETQTPAAGAVCGLDSESSAVPALLLHVMTMTCRSVLHGHGPLMDIRISISREPPESEEGDVVEHIAAVTGAGRADGHGVSAGPAGESRRAVIGKRAEQGRAIASLAGHGC